MKIATCDMAAGRTADKHVVLDKATLEERLDRTVTGSELEGMEVGNAVEDGIIADCALDSILAGGEVDCRVAGDVLAGTGWWYITRHTCNSGAQGKVAKQSPIPI